MGRNSIFKRLLLTWKDKRFQRANERIMAFNPMLDKSNPYLFSIGLEITNICNYRCRMCPAHGEGAPMERPRGFMDMVLFQKVIDDVCMIDKDMNIMINFAGESLLHKQFGEMLDYMRSKGVSNLTINTNGSILDDVLADKMLKTIGKKIFISIDGMRESHEAQRIGSDWEQVVSNTKRLLERKTQLGLKRPYIVISLTKTNQGDEEIEEFKAMWKGMPVKVNVNEATTQYYTYDFFNPDVLERIRVPCKVLWNQAYILWTGEMVMCCSDLRGTYVIGNITEESLIDIWHGDRYRKLRDLHFRGLAHTVPVCDKCQIWATLVDLKPLLENIGLSETDLYIKKPQQSAIGND